MRHVPVGVVTRRIVEQAWHAVRQDRSEGHVGAFGDEVAAELDRPHGAAQQDRGDRVQPHGLAKRPVQAGEPVHGRQVEGCSVGQDVALLGEDLAELVRVLQQVDHGPAEMTGRAVVPGERQAHRQLDDPHLGDWFAVRSSCRGQHLEANLRHP
jgi:hypothetical protein